MHLNSVVGLFLGVQIFDVNEASVTENSVTLICQLPCFSPDLQCVLYDMDVNVTIDPGNIIGSVESYSYPTQAMIISGLNSSTTYNYCINLYNITDMMEVGESVCGSFNTQKMISETNDVGIIKFYGMIDMHTLIDNCVYITIKHAPAVHTPAVT